MTKRIVVGDIEVALRPGYAWVENGRVYESQIEDLRAALTQAQQILRGQS